MVRDVFDPTVSDARRREILAEYRVTYLVVRERDNADEALSAAVGRYLTLAFSSGDTTVYRVTATHLPNG
jgi:hypothetical protein